MALENPSTPPLLSNAEARKQANLIKALADPARLQILHILKQRGGTITVDELVECFDLQQPTISHHLRILRDVDLVSYKKAGMHIYYSIEAVKVAEAYMNVRSLLPQKGQ